MTMQVSEILSHGKDMFIQQSIQHHGWWWPGNARSQGISSHCIKPGSQNFLAGFELMCIDVVWQIHSHIFSKVSFSIDT